MRIVFQKVSQWESLPNAEAELARRMLIAAETINVEALATSGMEEIADFNPDIVIPLHFFIPKLFDAFTVGCLWNPSYAIQHNQAWDNVKTYDGYGVASESQEQLVKTLKFKSPVPYLLTTIYPSSNSTEFRKPKCFTNPVYIGSNWNKDRHKDFFTTVRNIQVYGPRDRWLHLAGKEGVYRGEVPFDGSSALVKYHEAGIGLALHHESHNQEGIPSMRPFEIAASGAVMIADQNEFVRKVFGDNALYLDTELNSAELAEQLEEHVHWIKTHHAQAQEMAFACHEIFCQKYSLEVLLKTLVNDVQEFNTNTCLRQVADVPLVELIIRSDGKQINRLLRALESIQKQTYPCVRVNIIFRGKLDELPALKEKVLQEFPQVEVVYTVKDGNTDRGAQFFAGLRATSAEFIGFLDHDDIIFEDHISVLMSILQRDKAIGVAYGGSVRVWEEEGEPPSGDMVRKLTYFHDFESFSEKAFITSNSYLVRRENIPWHIMNQSIPSMDCREDRLFLKLLYRDKVKFVFSEKVTSAFYCRVSKQDHSNESEEILEQGKKTSDLILRLATSPWRHPSNALPVQEIVILKLMKETVAVVKNDFFQVVKHLQHLLKK